MRAERVLVLVATNTTWAGGEDGGWRRDYHESRIGSVIFCEKPDEKTHRSRRPSGRGQVPGEGIGGPAFRDNVYRA